MYRGVYPLFSSWLQKGFIMGWFWPGDHHKVVKGACSAFFGFSNFQTLDCVFVCVFPLWHVEQASRSICSSCASRFRVASWIQRSRILTGQHRFSIGRFQYFCMILYISVLWSFDAWSPDKSTCQLFLKRPHTHEKLRSSGATSTSTMIHLWTPSCLYMVFWWVWMGCQTVHWHLGSVAFWHRSSHMWVYILRLCKIIWHRPTISGTLPIWRHTELHVISCHSSTMRFRGQGTRIQSTKATLSRFRNWCLSWRKMTAWCTQRRVSTLATSRMALALSWWLCVMHLGTKMTGSDWRAWTRQRRSTFIPRQVITFVSVRQHFWDVLCFAVKFAGQR